jgi:hypothetical protein
MVMQRDELSEIAAIGLVFGQHAFPFPILVIAWPYYKRFVLYRSAIFRRFSPGGMVFA